VRLAAAVEGLERDLWRCSQLLSCCDQAIVRALGVGLVYALRRRNVWLLTAVLCLRFGAALQPQRA
jgi:hypothetical protein